MLPETVKWVAVELASEVTLSALKAESFKTQAVATVPVDVRPLRKVGKVIV